MYESSGARNLWLETPATAEHCRELPKQRACRAVKLLDYEVRGYWLALNSWQLHPRSLPLSRGSRESVRGSLAWSQKTESHQAQLTINDHFQGKNSCPTSPESQNSGVSLKKERLLPLTPFLCSGFVAPLVLLAPSCTAGLWWHLNCWGGTQTVGMTLRLLSDSTFQITTATLCLICFFHAWKELCNCLTASHKDSEPPDGPIEHQSRCTFQRLGHRSHLPPHPTPRVVALWTGTKMWWGFQAFWHCSPGSFLAHCTFSAEI